jgi:hypothetical protein
MTWLPHDLGTWGFILSIIALLAMYPVGLLINMTTPAIQNWLAKFTRASLEKRIAELERRLEKLEEIPELSDVDNHILWEVKSTRLTVISHTNIVLLFMLLAVGVVAKTDSPEFIGFSRIVLLVVLLSGTLLMLLRYQHDFRYERSPDVRKSLRKAIAELKEFRQNDEATKKRI